LCQGSWKYIYFGKMKIQKLLFIDDFYGFHSIWFKLHSPIFWCSS
jgi:hypothetical protein